LQYFRFWKRVLILLTAGAAITLAQPSSPDTDTPEPSPSLLDRLWTLPIARMLAPVPATAMPAPLPSTCKVAPLPPIEDEEALSFEKNDSPDAAINIAGLMPAMARALEKFREMVMSAGGSFDLKSAYRPPAYQAHLQEVWYKWVQLRYNRQPGCRILKAEVAAEFARHHLLPTQKPVTSSDHTRGLAFDAAVILPRGARTTKRRRISLDRLALQAGIKRPDIRRDPVHFKLADVPAVITLLVP